MTGAAVADPMAHFNQIQAAEAVADCSRSSPRGSPMSPLRRHHHGTRDGSWLGLLPAGHALNVS
jgi:hypothetical protein